MVPAGLLEEQHRPVRAGLHANGHDSHLVHGAPTFSAARLTSACVTRTTGPGDATPPLIRRYGPSRGEARQPGPARLRAALHDHPSTQLPMPGAGCPAGPRACLGLVTSCTEGRDVLVHDVGDVGSDRLGVVQRRLTSRRCQRRIVEGGDGRVVAGSGAVVTARSVPAGPW